MSFFKSSRQKGEEDGAVGEKDIVSYSLDKDYREGYDHGKGLHDGQKLAKNHDESIIEGLVNRGPFETLGESRAYKEGYVQGYAGYEGKKYLPPKYLRGRPIPITERRERREESARRTDSSHTGPYLYGSGSYSSYRRKAVKPHRGAPILLKGVLGLLGVVVLVLIGGLAGQTIPFVYEFLPVSSGTKIYIADAEGKIREMYVIDVERKISKLKRLMENDEWTRRECQWPTLYPLLESSDCLNYLVLLKDKEIEILGTGGIDYYHYESQHIKLADESPPVCSSDGRIVAFASDDGYIYLMDYDGRHILKVTKGRSPRWSPDGKKIVFTRR